MRLADQSRKTRGRVGGLGLRRRQQQVDVVRQQAIGRADDAVKLQPLSDKIAIQRVIRRLGKDRHLTIAVLGDVMGNVGQDDAGEASHDASCHDAYYRAIGIMSPKKWRAVPASPSDKLAVSQARVGSAAPAMSANLCKHLRRARRPAKNNIDATNPLVLRRPEGPSKDAPGIRTAHAGRFSPLGRLRPGLARSVVQLERHSRPLRS